MFRSRLRRRPFYIVIMTIRIPMLRSSTAGEIPLFITTVSLADDACGGFANLQESVDDYCLLYDQ